MSSGQQWVLVEMVQAFYEVSSWGSSSGVSDRDSGLGRCFGGAEFAFWVTSYPDIS